VVGPWFSELLSYHVWQSLSVRETLLSGGADGSSVIRMEVCLSALLWNKSEGVPGARMRGLCAQGVPRSLGAWIPLWVRVNSSWGLMLVTSWGE
jgi:hypothetical protein